MSDTKEFDYKSKHVKITAQKTAKGNYVGFLEIDGIDLSGREIGEGMPTIADEFSEGERKAKEIIDADG